MQEAAGWQAPRFQSGKSWKMICTNMAHTRTQLKFVPAPKKKRRKSNKTLTTKGRGFVRSKAPKTPNTFRSLAPTLRRYSAQTPWSVHFRFLWPSSRDARKPRLGVGPCALKWNHLSMLGCFGFAVSDRMCYSMDVAWPETFFILFRKQDRQAVDYADHPTVRYSLRMSTNPHLMSLDLRRHIILSYL